MTKYTLTGETNYEGDKCPRCGSHDTAMGDTVDVVSEDQPDYLVCLNCDTRFDEDFGIINESKSNETEYNTLWDLWHGKGHVTTGMTGNDKAEMVMLSGMTFDDPYSLTLLDREDLPDDMQQFLQQNPASLIKSRPFDAESIAKEQNPLGDAGMWATGDPDPNKEHQDWQDMFSDPVEENPSPAKNEGTMGFYCPYCSQQFINTDWNYIYNHAESIHGMREDKARKFADDFTSEPFQGEANIPSGKSWYDIANDRVEQGLSGDYGGALGMDSMLGMNLNQWGKSDTQCPNCGSTNYNLGQIKDYRCVNCGTEYDDDWKPTGDQPSIKDKDDYDVLKTDPQIQRGVGGWGFGGVPDLIPDEAKNDPRGFYESITKLIAKEFKPELQGKKIRILKGDHEGEIEVVTSVGIFDDNVTVNIDGNNYYNIPKGEYEVLGESYANEAISHDKCPECNFETSWKEGDSEQEKDAEREMDEHITNKHKGHSMLDPYANEYNAITKIITEGRDDPRKPGESEMEYWERTGQILSSRVWDEKQQKMVDAKTGKDEWSNEGRTEANEYIDEQGDEWIPAGDGWFNKSKRGVFDDELNPETAKLISGIINKDARKKARGEASLTPKEDYDLGMSELEGKIDWEWNKLPMTKRKQLAMDAGVEEEDAQEMSRRQDWQDVRFNHGRWEGEIERYMRSQGIVHESYAKEFDSTCPYCGKELPDEAKSPDFKNYYDTLIDHMREEHPNIDTKTSYDLTESYAKEGDWRSPMPPCFDCGIPLSTGNVVRATPLEVSARPDYDFRTYQPGDELITLCDSCDSRRLIREHPELAESYAKEVNPTPQEWWDEEGWKEQDFTWGGKPATSYGHWDTLTKEEQDDITQRFNAMIDEEPTLFESKSKYTLMETTGHGGLAIGQENDEYGFTLGGNVARCNTCNWVYTKDEGEEWKGLKEHQQDHVNLGNDYVRMEGESKANEHAWQCDQCGKQLPDAKAADQHQKETGHTDMGFAMTATMPEDPLFKAKEVTQEDFEYLSRNDTYEILANVLGWSHEEAESGQDLVEWDDFTNEEKDKIKNYSGEAKATEKGETYIFMWRKMDEDMRKGMLRSTWNSEYEVAAYKGTDWEQLPTNVQEDLKVKMNELFRESGQEGLSKIEEGVRDAINLLLEGNMSISSQEIESRLASWGYNSDEIKKGMRSYFGEAMYGFGSATGRMSPSEHWKQGLDAYGDMGYDSKLASPMYQNFQGMSWNELPEEIKQAYMAKHDYIDTTQTEALRAIEDYTFGSAEQAKFESLEWLWGITSVDQHRQMLNAEGWGDDNTVGGDIDQFRKEREEQIVLPYDQLSINIKGYKPEESIRRLMGVVGVTEAKKKAIEDNLWQSQGEQLNCPVCGMDFNSGRDMGDHLIVEHQWEESDFEQFEEGRVNEAERKVSPSSFMKFTEPIKSPTGKVVMDQTYGTSEPETDDGQDLTGKTLRRKGTNDG